MKFTSSIFATAAFAIAASVLASAPAHAKLMTFRSDAIIVNMDTNDISDIHIDEKSKSRVVMCLSARQASRLSALTYQSGGGLVQIGIQGREIARPVARAAGNGECFLIPFGNQKTASAFEERITALLPKEEEEAETAPATENSVSVQ